MSEIAEPELWIWQDPSKMYIGDVINYINSFKSDKELVILHSFSSPVPSGQLIVEYMFEVCQKFNLLQSDRTTFLSCKDHLLALELCMSSVKRKNGEEVEVNEQDVLSCHNKYIKDCLNISTEVANEKEKMYICSYKKYLEHSNCIDLWSLYSLIQRNITAVDSKMCNYILLSRFLLLGSFETEVFIYWIKLLTTNNKIFSIIAEIPLDEHAQASPNGIKFPSKDPVSLTLSKQLIAIDEISITHSYTENIKSAIKEYAEDTILAFLGLLVNCRNELFLSRAMTSPIIDLSHSAFTDLKHVSVQKEMPMCQTVISYVTRLRLGGKSYAPSSDCPLVNHLQGLELFVDLLNQLQTVLEEEKLTESAVKRVINILKKRLLKSKSNLRDSSIEDAVNDLIEASLEIVKQHYSEDRKTTQVGQKAFDALYNLVNSRAFHDCFNSEVIMKRNNLHRTPMSHAPLMGYFRSPDEDSCSHEDSKSSFRSKERIAMDIPTETTSSLSYVHSSNSNSVHKSCIDEHTPTKTTFKGCLTEQENCGIRVITTISSTERKPLSFNKDGNKPGIKRSILGDISNAKQPKKASTVLASKKKVKAKTKQIKGQGQITNFFTRK